MDKNKRIDELEKQMDSLEREINKCALFAEGVKSDFWKEIESRFKYRLEEVEKYIDDFSGRNDEEWKLFWAEGQKQEIKKILSVKDFSVKRSVLMKRHAMIQKKTKELKSGK